MIFKLIVYGFLFYAIYRLVFHFIIPIYKASHTVKNQFGEMQNRMQDFMNQQQKAQQTKAKAPNEKKHNNTDDYIDFEEVK